MLLGAPLSIGNSMAFISMHRATTILKSAARKGLRVQTPSPALRGITSVSVVATGTFTTEREDRQALSGRYPLLAASAELDERW